MKRKLYLEGALGERFGKQFTIRAVSPAEALRCLEANFGDDFRKYFIEAHEKQVSFAVEVAGEAIQQEELLMPINTGDIVITPVPAGSKSAGTKILTAIAIVAALYMPLPGLGESIASLSSAGLATAGTIYTIGMTVAVNLALAGVQQMMMPDPSTDKDQNTSYLFNGSEQNVIEGDPVPVLYGRLRVPGQPIAFETISGSRSLGTSGVVNSIALDSSVDVVDVDSAAIYITPTGDTTAITLTNTGNTSGGNASSGVNESTSLKFN